VFLKHSAQTALVTAITLLIPFSPALSRQWKITPEALASDYGAISDSRPGELVTVTWFVSPMRKANAAALVAMTQKYVVLMAADRKLDKPTGLPLFEEINELEPKDQNGKSLAPVARNDLSPASAAALAGLEAFWRQSSALNKGIKMFVFEKGDVDSCQRGQLSVRLAGENYTWETPFPGYSKTVGQDKSADRT
jgi:hypothetical protein